MCGIAGIINLRRSFSADNLRHLIKEMTDQMVHRGPDDSGAWIAPGDACAFGQRRLSIIDLSSAGHQPMFSLDGKAVITFNGEIFNYLELRAELESQGVRFRTQTDTEVLIEAIRVWGEEAFQKLDGMYAFALFDEPTGDIIIGRDPFGEKPLYYTQNEDYFAFASELHCLTKLPNFDFGVEDVAMAELLMLQYIHAPRTVYRGTKKLPPGHFMRISADGRVTVKQHFSFKPQPAPYSNRSIVDLADELQEILIRSIKRRMISDVPLGAFLSGGVDSSLVVALMAKECGRDVQTFSIGFAGDKDSEHEFARATAKYLGTTHHEKILAPDVMQLVERIARVLDEPNADSSCLPVYLLSEFARERVTVALSGDGGDELFGGYGRYFATLDEEVKQRAGDPAFANWSPGETYFGPRICVFSLDQVRRVMRSVSPDAEALIQSFKNSLNHSELPLMHRMREIDARTYMPGAVLAKVDRMSMQHALEVRTPFLSIEVARFAEKLSPEQCYQNGNGKLVLKELLCRYLPREFVYRPKQGFGLPTGVWGKESLLPATRIACDTPFSRSSHWLPRGLIKRFLAEQESSFSTYQVWNVLMLEMWLRAHRAEGANVSTSTTHVSTFERVLSPFCENLPLLESLGASRKDVGVFVGVNAPPSYLGRFFETLHYVELPLETDGSVSWNRLRRSLTSLSASTVVLAEGARECDIETLIALRKKGYRRFFFYDGKGWRGSMLTPWLHSRAPFLIRSAVRRMTNAGQRFCRRARLAVASRVLNRFSEDLFPRAQVVRPDEGLAWQAQVLQFSSWSNDVGLERSDLLLFENEKLLAKGAAQTEIREEGGGRYLHWGDSIYFSTTDSTDPRTNGRRYRIIHKPRKTKMLRSLWLAPERIFDSIKGPSDSLAVWYKELRYDLSRLNPFSLLVSQEWLKDISSTKRLEIFERDVALHRPHGVRVTGEKSEGIILFTSHLGPGGAERQLSYLAASLKAHGHKVLVVSESEPVGVAGHYVPTLAKAGISISGLHEPVGSSELLDLIRPDLMADVMLLASLPKEFISSVQSLYTLLMKERPAVLHCFLDSPNIIGAVAGYLAGVPKIVISVRNVNPTNFDYLNVDWFRPWYRAVLAIPSVVFTANSRAGRESYSSWLGIDANRIEVIPNAIDLNSFLAQPDRPSHDTLGALGIAPAAPVMLGVFRLSHEKRPLLFLEVAEEVKRLVPDLVVLIAGVGTMQAEVEQHIKERGIHSFVKLLGRQEAVAELVMVCDVLALFSENEGSPNVILEAQALGRAVVCTAVGGSPDIVLDGVTGYLVAKDDRAAMVGRTAELLGSPELRSSMGAAAAARTTAEFSVEKLTGRTLLAYGRGFAGVGQPDQSANEGQILAVGNR